MTRPCVDCGRPSYGPRAARCEDCNVLARRRWRREYDARRRPSTAAPVCADCKSAPPRRHNARYCVQCFEARQRYQWRLRRVDARLRDSAKVGHVLRAAATKLLELAEKEPPNCREVRVVGDLLLMTSDRMRDLAAKR